MTWRAKRPVYYYITDRRRLPGGSVAALMNSIARALSWGVDYVQLREKDLTDLASLKLTAEVVRLSRGSGCRILVNGRLDVAIAGGAHGVHLPSEWIDPAVVKSRLPKDFLLGVSAHSLEEVRRASAAGADYVLLGPLFRTPSKVKYGKPMGIPRFRAICSRVSIPVFGLGGIRSERIPRVLQAGAAGIAGIGIFQRDLPLVSRDLVHSASVCALR